MIDYQTFLTTQDEKIKSEFIKQAELCPEEYVDRLLVNNKNCAHALSVLTRKGSVVKMLGKKFEKVLENYFASNDAKIRKYAYIIAGNYQSQLSQKLLSESVQTENTYYTLPSLMLALGGQKCFAQKLLERVEKERENIAPKIYNEIVSAYQKVCPITVYECQNISFEKEDFLVTTQKRYEDYLCKFIPFKKEKTKRGIVCKNIDLTGFRQLSSRRDIYEVLLVVGSFSSIDTAVNKALDKLENLVKNNAKPIGFRISCNDNKIKEKVLSLVSTNKKTGLVNSPSNYSVSVEFFIEKQITAYIKFEKFKPDFSYRTEFLPASINPVTANIIASIAQIYNPNAKIVCDGFCGTGTMLVERYYTNDKIKVVGSDISRDAIKKAKTNFSNAKISAELFVKDITNFSTPCDEIISNLPYGLRVGTHKANLEIYTALVNACKNSLTKGGFGFLYTADKKLLRDLIKKSPLKLIDELSLISGGLYCSLFIVQKQN